MAFRSIDPLVPTVFHNRWWLEAASGGTYREVEVRSDGRVVARMPYVEARRFGMHRLCLMPELTHFLGPAVDCPEGSLANRALRRHHLTLELLSQLRPFAGFYQCMHRGIAETLAFEACGYLTEVQFTYEIQPQPIEQTWRLMRDKTRNVVRRAQDRWEVSVLQDPLAFGAVYDENLRKRGFKNSYSRIPAVCAMAVAQGQGLLLAVKDQHRILGAIFLVWDESTAYYLLSTRSPDADNGVISLLIWEAIQMASRLNLVFDFDGMGQPGSRLLFTGFGGQAVPRYVVSKNRFSLRAYSAVARLVGKGFA